MHIIHLSASLLNLKYQPQSSAKSFLSTHPFLSVCSSVRDVSANAVNPLIADCQLQIASTINSVFTGLFLLIRV